MDGEYVGVRRLFSSCYEWVAANPAQKERERPRFNERQPRDLQTDMCEINNYAEHLLYLMETFYIRKIKSPPALYIVLFFIYSLYIYQKNLKAFFLFF